LIYQSQEQAPAFLTLFIGKQARQQQSFSLLSPNRQAPSPLLHLYFIRSFF
jgi:hypothetical protein